MRGTGKRPLSFGTIIGGRALLSVGGITQRRVGVGVAVNKRLVSYHIGRLRDASSAVRLKAIAELKLLGDPEALEALQHVFQSDSNHEVRKAAQEAGRAIFLQQKKTKPL